MHTRLIKIKYFKLALDIGYEYVYFYYVDDSPVDAET